KFYKSMPGEVRSDLISLMNSNASLDPKILAAEISRPIVKQLKSQPGVAITIDEHGSHLSVVKGMDRFTYLEKYFNVKIK
ncbi:MAG: hypothetical protein RLN85_05105, partial [Pseudomonadales bacterium]